MRIVVVRRRRGRHGDRHAAAGRRASATSSSGDREGVLSPRRRPAVRRPSASSPSTPTRAGVHRRPARGARAAPTSSSACQRARTCSTGERHRRRWPTDADRLRAGQPRPRGRPGRGRASTPPWSPPAAPTTPTRSTTCWPSPASSAACSTPAPREITIDMLLRAAEAIAHVVERRGAQRQLHHPQRLPPRGAQGRGRGHPGAVNRAGGRLDGVTTTLGDFTATDIDGDDVDLSPYAGQVVLVVNTASQCGLTPQYAGLQQLYDRRQPTAASWCSASRATSSATRSRAPRQEIAAFCETSYGVTFPMFAKVDVNGDDAHPLYDVAARARRAGTSRRPTSSGTSPSSSSAATAR